MTNPTCRPATLLTSGTHEFAKAGPLMFVATLVGVIAYGVYTSARDALLKR
jgi:hypothetical protein